MTPKTAVVLILIASAVSIASGQTDDSSGPAEITFRSGNQLDGDVVTKTTDEKREFVVLRTRSGSIWKLDEGKLISRIVTRGPEHIEYDKLIAKMPDTAQAHWQMYDWCRADGRRSRFKQEMDFHLKKIVALDASDSKAWQLLGYIDVAGRWIPEEQHYLSRGYVKSGRRWIPEVQVAVDRQRDSQEQFRDDRKVALGKWKKNIWPSASREDARSELFKIIDPVSVVFLANNHLKSEKNPDTRILYLEAIGRVESPFAQQVLVDFTLKDDDPDVRETAMTQLEQPHFDPDVSTRQFARYLSNSNNGLVNRAARMIGRLNRESAIIPLIGSLVTEHQVQPGTDPGRLNMGFGSGGTGFTTGGEKPVIRMFQNEDVLLALEQITGQRRLGFDDQLWKQWYVSQHTITDYDFHRDND